MFSEMKEIKVIEFNDEEQKLLTRDSAMQQLELKKQ